MLVVRADPVTAAFTNCEWFAANTKLTSGQQLTVMGWGAMTEGGNEAAALMTVDVATTDVNTCRGVYGNRIDGETQICAGVPEGGKDACQGDSGGPLIIRGTSAAEDVQVGGHRGQPLYEMPGVLRTSIVVGSYLDCINCQCVRKTRWMLNVAHYGSLTVRLGY